MEITFLGTGTSQGVPVIACKCKTCLSEDIRDKRLRSSVLIKYKDKTFVIDAGPDFRQQMLRKQVDNLDFILLTHEHKDHIAGLDDIRSYNYLQKKAMPIYCEKRVANAIKIEYAYVFAEKKYPGIPEMNLQVIDNNKFIADGVEVVPIRTMHHKLPILAYRIAGFTYITDTNFIKKEELQKIKGTKVLVVNALRKEKHLSHYNLEEALNIISEIMPEVAYLTHMSHFMGLHKDLLSILPENVFPAYDGLKVKF